MSNKFNKILSMGTRGTGGGQVKNTSHVPRMRNKFNKITQRGQGGQVKWTNSEKNYPETPYPLFLGGKTPLENFQRIINFTCPLVPFLIKY
jgi:hypothetical protein